MSWGYIWWNAFFTALLAAGIKWVFDPAWWIAILIALLLVVGVGLIVNSDDLF